MTKARNILATLLVGLVAVNGTCVCAAKADMRVVVPQMHHGHGQEVAQDADCLQPDCAGGCERAVGAASSKETSEPASVKFAADIDAVPFHVAFHVRTLGGGATGPPDASTSLPALTPVIRFDRQLK